MRGMDGWDSPSMVRCRHGHVIAINDGWYGGGVGPVGRGQEHVVWIEDLGHVGDQQWWPDRFGSCYCSCSSRDHPFQFNYGLITILLLLRHLQHPVAPRPSIAHFSGPPLIYISPACPLHCTSISLPIITLLTNI